MINTIELNRIVLATSDVVFLDRWVALASALTLDPTAISLYGMITVSEDKSLSEGANWARQFRDSLAPLLQDYPFIYDQTEIHVDYRPMEHLLDKLPGSSVDLLIVQWAGPDALIGGLSTDYILQHALCDVVLISPDVWNKQGPVMLAARGGSNITLSMKVAKALAKEDSVTLFHATSNRRATPDLFHFMKLDPQIGRSVTAVGDIPCSIVREAAGHKATVLGATFHNTEMTTSALGPLVTYLHSHSDVPLAVVRAWHPESTEFHLPRHGKRSESLSTMVDRWFAENTFHSHEFSDLNTLCVLKEKQGLTISVALPALDEEETIGNVIRTLKTALMDETHLVDEIVLIDSNSTDSTVAIAETFGIPIYEHPEILPEIGSLRGKGEALWKSLHVLTGDIIVWVDTDITNMHPRFVYGLIGPLLRHPHLQYIKGFYQRPIMVGEQLERYGGGRVTELVARPLLNLFYPELSGIIQPLSGEYAGRRTALESVPFFSGYGVETGLLIDLHQKFGLEGIAQADLEERIHYNQPLVDLSKMSFAILQVFMSRLASRYDAQFLDYAANHSMKLIAHDEDRFALDIVEIGDVERPPMNTIPSYGGIRELMVMAENMALMTV